MEPDIRIFVVVHKKKCYVYTEATLKVWEEEIAALSESPCPDGVTEEAWAERTEEQKRQYDLLMSKGQWREVWLKEATAEHEEKIAALCQEKDEAAGLRFNPIYERSARIAVLVDKWNGFGRAPGIEAAKGLHPRIAEVLDRAIQEFVFPSAMDADFFGA